ncbi:Cullin-domain-containing protein [Tilletiopsis washingtonensis]|uniref:Cullin-domain-containing protein n=1 Tax=Tilletiopsis washingtonensis TaxID=58919 RepID=A0A316ZEQ1_9BASI|nr:Cullin-domain-containing protein [Tilletiopsis washingtonensis]PWO00002.1 Cullin-domain-containing protein [Tilletiopsis washingtonensis]
MSLAALFAPRSARSTAGLPSLAALPVLASSSQPSCPSLLRALRHFLLSDAPLSPDSVYTQTQRLVAAGQASALSDGVRAELSRAVLRTRDAAALGGMPALLTAWQAWTARSRLVADMFLPLDALQPHSDRIEAVCAELFKEHVLLHAPLLQSTLDALGAQLSAVRSLTHTSGAATGSVTSADHEKQIEALAALFTTLDSQDIFAESLVQHTAADYAREAARFAPSASDVVEQERPEAMEITVFLQHVARRVQEEQARAMRLLATGREDVVHAAMKELLGGDGEGLISHLPSLLSSPATSALRTLYALLQRVSPDALSPLRTAWAKVTRELITSALGTSGSAGSEGTIPALLELKRKLDLVLSDAFEKDDKMRHALQEAFEQLLNTKGNSVAEDVAKFLDAKLRSGNKTMSDAEMERTLDEALELFRYTHDKDMFEEFYKRLFAKRLLLNRSASSDAELSMLLKLKRECGAAFTDKLETMLKDMSVSDDIMKSYALVQDKATRQGEGEQFELSVHVLTAAQWPTYPPVDLRLPADMSASLERFRTFYTGRNAGRRVAWAHSLGTLSLKAVLPRAGEKELHVSLFQALVLLLFNDEERLSFGQIRERVGLEEKELRRTLQSLACGQIPTRVLRKEPQGKDVNDSDEFVVNPSLKNERGRIRINQIQMAETAEEQTSTRERVMFDRNMLLDAAVVRIMKAKQTLPHNLLVQDVVGATKDRFAPDVKEIKARISSLIEREYMERVDGERGVYRYVA